MRDRPSRLPEGVAAPVVDGNAATKGQDSTRDPEEYARIFRRSPVALVLLGSRAGSHDILRCNAAFGELLGAAPQDLAGRDFSELFPPERSDLYWLRLGTVEEYRTLNLGSDPPLEAELLHADGGSVAVLIHVGPSEWDGYYQRPGQVVAVYPRNREEDALTRLSAANQRLRMSIHDTHHRTMRQLEGILAMLSMLHDRDFIADAIRDPGDLESLIADYRMTALVTERLLLDDVPPPVMDPHDPKSDNSWGVNCFFLQPFLESALRQWDLDTAGRPVRIEAEGVRLHVRQCLRLTGFFYETLKNALQHGKGSIILRAHEANGRVEVSTTDEGPGFPEGFVPRSGVGVLGTTETLGLGRVEQCTWPGAGLRRAEAFYENLPEGGARVRVVFDSWE
jgi:PAS domain S-box-containing protein